MQALVRSSLRVARGGAAGTTQQVRNSGAMGKVDVETELKEMKKWKIITLFVGIPVCIVKGAYDLSQPHEHHKQAEYPYLKIRSKEFPWGKCDLFDEECKKGAEH